MSTARPDTWMPIFWGDYARDTGHLNNAGHGAYLMLIKHYWSTGKPLPDNDDLLWRIACCDSKKDWFKIRPLIVSFFIVAEGAWSHKRVAEELIRAEDNLKRQQARTAAATEARRTRGEHRNDERDIYISAQRNDERDEDRNEQRNVDRNEVHRAAVSPSSSTSPPPSEDLSAEFEAWYQAYPRHIARAAALKAYRKARKTATAEQLLASIERYRADKPEYADWKHPATWLNGECWLDEKAPAGRIPSAGAASPVSMTAAHGSEREAAELNRSRLRLLIEAGWPAKDAAAIVGTNPSDAELAAKVAEKAKPLPDETEDPLRPYDLARTA